MNTTDIRPPGAECEIDGSWYKIGRYGLPFRFNGDEWIKSEKETVEIELCKKKKKSL